MLSCKITHVRKPEGAITYNVAFDAPHKVEAKLADVWWQQYISNMYSHLLEPV